MWPSFMLNTWISLNREDFLSVNVDITFEFKLPTLNTKCLQEAILYNRLTYYTTLNAAFLQWSIRLPTNIINKKNIITHIVNVQQTIAYSTISLTLFATKEPYFIRSHCPQKSNTTYYLLTVKYNTHTQIYIQFYGLSVRKVAKCVSVCICIRVCVSRL